MIEEVNKVDETLFGDGSDSIATTSSTTSSSIATDPSMSKGASYSAFQSKNKRRKDQVETSLKWS